MEGVWRALMDIKDKPHEDTFLRSDKHTVAHLRYVAGKTPGRVALERDNRGRLDSDSRGLKRQKKGGNYKAGDPADLGQAEQELGISKPTHKREMDAEVASNTPKNLHRLLEDFEVSSFDSTDPTFPDKRRGPKRLPEVSAEESQLALLMMVEAGMAAQVVLEDPQDIKDIPATKRERRESESYIYLTREDFDACLRRTKKLRDIREDESGDAVTGGDLTKRALEMLSEAGIAAQAVLKDPRAIQHIPAEDGELYEQDAYLYITREEFSACLRWWVNRL